LFLVPGNMLFIAGDAFPVFSIVALTGADSTAVFRYKRVHKFASSRFLCQS
jgi:hypothetical protein